MRADFCVRGSFANGRTRRAYVALSEPLERRVLLSAGDPDPTFDGDGKLLAGNPPFITRDVGDVAVQPDGKVILAGVEYTRSAPFTITSSAFYVARYNSDGTPDVGFGVGGRAAPAFAGAGGAAGAVALQPDGKILVAGSASNGSDSDFAVARYNANGTLDATFDGDGLVLTNLGAGSNDGIADIAVAPDGKVVVVGGGQATGGFTVVCYNANGTPDTTFGTQGKTSITFGSAAGDTASAVAVRADGKVLVAGTANHGEQGNWETDLILAQFNAGGTPDGGFGSGGKVVTTFGDTYGGDGRDLWLKPDGKAVVVGAAGGGFALAQYTPTGTLDAAFGGDGTVVVALGGPANAVAVLADGDIVAAGASWAEGTNYDFTATRLNPDGSPDTAFSGDGVVTADFYADWDMARALAVAPGGKIVAAGTATFFGLDGDGVIRWNGDGSPDTSFSGDGKVTGTGAGHNREIAAVATQPDGKIVVGGSVTALGSRDFTVARYNADGTLDTTFARGGADGDGYASADFGGRFDGVGALLVQDDGRIVAGGWTTDSGRFDAHGQFALARFNPDGTLDRTFSGDGITRNDVGADSRILNLAAYPGGKILAAGSGGAARYNPDGTLDTTFSGDGKLPVPAADGRVISVAVVGDKVVLARPLGIRRYNADGTPDPSFAEVTLPERGSIDWPYFELSDVDLTNDGDLLATGAFYGWFHETPDAFLAIRYNADGSQDQSFGPGLGYPRGSGDWMRMMITTVPGTRWSGAVATEVQPDGKFVCAGTGESGGLVLARFTPHGDLDPTFGQGGVKITTAGTVASPAALALSPDGDIVTIWNVLDGYGIAQFDGGPPPTEPVSLDGGNLIVRGGAAADVVLVRHVGDAVEASLNGTSRSFPASSVSHVYVSGGGGDDTLAVTAPGVVAYLDGDAGNDRLTASDGDDTLRGDAGDDTLDGGLGADRLHGDDGTDLITYASRTAPVGMGGEEGEGDGTFFDVEQFRGGAGDDQLVGLELVNTTLYGGAGNDTLTGMGGDDDLFGEDGDDFLFGSIGANRYDGGGGNDTIQPLFVAPDEVRGGPGVDTIDLSTIGPGASLAVDLDGEADDGQVGPDLNPAGNVFADVENIVGSGGDDVLTGSAANNRIDGGGGNDTLAGLAGNDTLLGGPGDDTLTDSEGSNTLDGGPGSDTVNGVPEDEVPVVHLYEAEDAQILGPVVSRQHGGYSGTGYADYQNLTQDYVAFHLQIPVAGAYRLALRYANGSTRDRPLDLQVHDQPPAPMSFPSTGAWSNWSVVSRDVRLSAGHQVIILTAAGASGPNLDTLSVTPVALQAEDATLSGVTVSGRNGGFEGFGYADYQNAAGDYVEWVLDMPAASRRRLTVRYANGAATDRPLALALNGAVVTPSLSFPRTGSWTTWSTASFELPLVGGANRVRLTSVGSNGPNLDFLAVGAETIPPSVEPVTYQAESASLAGPVVAKGNGGFTGTGYADYQNAVGEYVEFAYDAPTVGDYVLEFRYANGSSSDRPLELRVNGAVARPRLSFVPTGSWSTWRTSIATVALPAGHNRVRLTAIGSTGPNLDAVTIRPAGSLQGM